MDCSKLSAASESYAAKIKAIHAADDLENVRCKVRRTGREAIALLANAGLALDKGKTHVTQDHVERTIEALKQLLKEIG